MKTMLLVFSAALCAAFISINISSAKKNISEEARQQILEYKKLYAFHCSPDLAFLNFADSAANIPLLEGWGHYTMPVTTNNDSAHIYFEQGINMYYAFHIIESLASFDKATQFDPDFAMGYWGKALAYGPNINDMGYAASPDALTAMHKAKELSNSCPPVEKALINAMQVRYSTDTMQTREYLNQQYADAMKKVHTQFPADADAAVLYADALMVQHPWDLYDKYGKPKAWTPEIVNTLEEAMKIFPDHPGACHYYIHAIEGSDHPEKGMTIAAKLPLLMPGVSHMVHMPSHIYIRSGFYNEGVEVNEKAVMSYYNYAAEYYPVEDNTPLYLIHNLHMEATCANMDGRYAASMKISVDCRNSFDTSLLSAPGYFGGYVQYMYMTPFLTQVRFGKWDDILHSPAIPENDVYANILWHYVRGMAYARKHNFTNANAELAALRAAMGNKQLQDHPPAFNPAIAGTSVAEKILQASIAEERNNLPAAIAIMEEARDLEDNMIYNEPKDWPHPVRQYLGNIFLKAKKYSEAEKAYREDLLVNPHNGWSLTGLSTALIKQHKTTEAAGIKAQAKKAFERSDETITASVF